MDRERRRFTFELIQNEPLRELAAHWASLLHGVRPGERRQFDPAQCQTALPYIWLCQREPGGRYRIRLAGEEINLLFGPRLRGRYVDEVLEPEEAAEFTPKLDAVLDTPGLHWSEGPFFEANPEGTHGECVMMPLLERGVARIVIGGSVHGWRRRRDPARFRPEPKQELFVPLSELVGDGDPALVTGP